MVMMKIKSHDQTTSSIDPIIPSSTTSPTWKLYENPFYIFPDQKQELTDQKQVHRLHLPISTRKISNSFWDLAFIKPMMESELEMAREQINELKAELECERKARKKAESLNKRLSKELSEERKGKEALERVCEELAKEVSSDKAEINRMKQDMQEERKMLRVADVLREERVHMKLAEAKMLMEEKFSEFEVSKKNEVGSLPSSSGLKKVKSDHTEENANHHHRALSFGDKLKFVFSENTQQSMALMRKSGSGEVENPHIKRGIKGFVEFPKVIRAIGCRSSKNSGSRLECQKAQLKVLLRQREGVRFNGLIAS